MQSNGYQRVIRGLSDRYPALSRAYLAAMRPLSTRYISHLSEDRIVIKNQDRKSTSYFFETTCEKQGRAKSVIKIEVIAGISNGASNSQQPLTATLCPKYGGEEQDGLGNAT
jgi:hypothetical protein